MSRVRVSEAVQIQNGFAFESELFSERRIGLPVARIRDVVRGYSETYYSGEYPKEYEIGNGDLLVGMDGEFNVGIWRGGRALLNQRVCKIIPKDGIADKHFLKHRLALLVKQIEAATPYVTVKHLSSEKLKAQQIDLPPLPEQKRVAAILEKADRLRRTRRYAHQLGDAFLQSVFFEMFGDPILNPKGWDIEHLADVIDPERPITYGILKPGPNIPAGVRYVRVVDMQDGAINAIGIRRTTKEIAREYRRSTLRPADILLSIRGHVGRLAIVPPFLNGANITQDTARLAANGRIRAPYLVECLRFRSLQARLADLTRGAAVQGINLGDVKLLPIPVPPIALQEKFAAIVRRFERLRAQQREAERQAEHLFQTLLNHAFSPESDRTFSELHQTT